MNKSRIYFIKPVGMDGPIKIGCSKMPEQRLTALATWSPFELEIIATIDGGQRLERSIHECFADLHSHREWFRPGRKLLEAITLIREGAPVEEAIDLKSPVGPIRKFTCGGAAWSDVTRQKMSVFHRVRGAMNKIGGSLYDPPKRIAGIVSASGKRLLNQDELALLKQFTDNPAQFASCSDRGAA